MAMPAPLFRKRPPERGFGYDATGVGGLLAAIGFCIVVTATAIPMGVLAEAGQWPLALLLGFVVVAETVAFVWFARRESERA